MFANLLKVAEKSIKDFDFVGEYIPRAPNGTPKDVIARLNKSLNTTLNDAAMKARLAELSTHPTGGTTEDATDFANKEAAKWKRVIEESNIKID